MNPTRICIVTSELLPFAKTGGLANVTAALARELERRGFELLVVTPDYPGVTRFEAPPEPVPGLQDIRLDCGPRRLWFSVSTAPLPRSSVRVHFVRCPELYARGSVYTNDPDEHLRFSLLSRAALEICQWRQWRPDVVHCHDWHTALIPLYLKTIYAWDRLFAGTRTVLTIHNLPHQGVFGAHVIDELGLGGERRYLHQEDLREERVNMLKTGLLYADRLTTVSETYAREIQTAEQGFGLEGILRTRARDLSGILNGVDYAEWDPRTDALIPARYSARDLRGKKRDKKALLERMGLPADSDPPVIGLVSRLGWQKGVDLIPPALGDVLEYTDTRFVAVGTGEARHEEAFARLADRNPGRAAYHRGFDNALAHLVEAGSDMFLMPSRYEPSGLNQMYSLRYGTIPIVRRTGGLADTVEEFDPATGEGTGFLFDELSPEALFGAVRRALELYGDAKAWRKLMRNAMAREFSWAEAGERYARLFQELTQAAPKES